ncbi:7TM diverse intracellular signaling domain-containing protein [Pseudobacteriovorax antillogorgiicola]|uniref:Adenylate and Guanylate cyclase catalytic domain-containing protein n=1 Tax=Pseudobacteriovorax antillogorgiicola TaxID=1513793 RepID=A0A1Y6C3Y0_9BACT|nr:7TM diverse intracellular signaling domain-containing protein [Pseudobacteriovorax antillogorgiicola]TCS49798.1 adenylate/guanylate cyclase family protein [Pseudobacteriovorax antillogorgiicola]SMF43007.1 Adenylate and Guanylate cyclase catalytic domain-containing protein [Pseudobacteriovorax antillogorgiicola]
MIRHLTKLLILAGLLSGCEGSRHAKPVIHNGHLDLSHWNFEDQGAVELHGPWRFVKGEPLDISVDPPETLSKFKMVPEIWQAQEPNALFESSANFGYGTYILTVQLPRELYSQTIGLRLGETFMASRVRAWDRQGQTVLGDIRQGNPSPIPKNEQPVAYEPLGKIIIPTDGFIMIQYEISNHIFKRTGVLEAPVIDDYERLSADLFRDFFLRAFIVGVCLIIGIFHFVLYNQRRDDTSALGFGVLCCFMAAREFTTARFVEFMGLVNSKETFEFMIRMTYLCLPTMVIATWKFYAGLNLLRGIYIPITNIFCFGYGIALIILTMTFDPIIFTNLLWLYLLHLVVGCITGICFLAYYCIKGDSLVIKITIAFVILVIGVANDILHHRQVIDTMWISPYTFIAFILIQSAIISGKSAAAFRKAQHSYNQLAKVFYPHQIKAMEAGQNLEDSMPVAKSEACVISFDIAGSSKINSPGTRQFFRDIFSKCGEIMMEGYDEETLQANAFRVKELGDGFLCTVGFPFSSPQGHIFEGAIVLSLRFMNAFCECLNEFNYPHPIYCGIGVVHGPVQSFFPDSSPIEYDLFGHGLTLATRYEEMRKFILKETGKKGNIIILQRHVFESLPPEMQNDFVRFDLTHGDAYVRDDPGAMVLYYRILNREQIVAAQPVASANKIVDQLQAS